MRVHSPLERDSDSTDAFGGGGASDPLPLATEVTADQPAGGAPATGVSLFASKRANRRMPAYVSPTGRSERLQPFMGSNDIMMVDVPAGGTLYSGSGAAMAADVGTATTPAPTTTNPLTMVPRRVLSVAATVNLMMEAKAAAAWCSRRLVGGGFHWTARFGLETALPATGRLFAGLCSLLTAITSGDPRGSISHAMALHKNSADSTLSLMFASTSTTNITVSLPNTGAVGWNVAGTIFQIEFFCVAGASDIGYRVTRTTPGSPASTAAPTVSIDEGVVLSATLGTAIPGIDVLFVPHIWAQNVAATATSLAVIQLYKESD